MGLQQWFRGRHERRALSSPTGRVRDGVAPHFRRASHGRFGQISSHPILKQGTPASGRAGASPVSVVRSHPLLPKPENRIYLVAEGRLRAAFSCVREQGIGNPLP